MTSSERDPLNVLVSRVLGTGLAVSLAAMGLGLALSWSTGAEPSSAATPLPALWPALKGGDANAFLSFGIVLLLATPAVRVLVLLVGYARRKDWLFAAIAAIVFAILTLSLLIGVR